MKGKGPKKEQKFQPEKYRRSDRKQRVAPEYIWKRFMLKTIN